VITIDAAELTVAAPRVTELHLDLTDAVARLAGLDLGVEMPPGVRGRVAAAVDAARTELTGAARAADGLGAAIARRAGLARLADVLGDLARPKGAMAYQATAASEYGRSTAIRSALRGDLAAARSARSVQLNAERFGSALKAAGSASTLLA